jgi:replicative DNA helicase
LVKDDFNTVLGIDQEQLGALTGLTDPDGGLTLEVVNAAKLLAKRYELVVLEYPPRSLTAGALEGALDRLERERGFVPDMIAVDYGDLMRVDTNNFRISIGDAFLQLRRIATERDAAVVTATQSNRGGARATLVTESDVAEDFSKIATADWAITYSQSAAERALSLARLYVAAGRDAEDKVTAVVAQSYARGQFCLDSAHLPDKWTALLSQATGETDGAE